MNSGILKAPMKLFSFRCLFLVRGSLTALIVGMLALLVSERAFAQSANAFQGRAIKQPLAKRHANTFVHRPTNNGPILYIDDEVGVLGTVDVNTGATTLIGATGVQLTDIAFAPDGTLYGLSFIALYEIDPNTAQATFIGYHGIPLGNALVFDANGTLFAAGGDSNYLYTINPATGLATVLGSTGYYSYGDLAFNNGTLFLSSTTSELVAISLSTYVGISLGPIGFDAVFGIATGDDGVLYGISGTQVLSLNTGSGAGTPLSNYQGGGLGDAFGSSFISESTQLPGLTLSMHSVSPDAISNGQSGVPVDEAIKPVASDTALQGQPILTQGLVADGVTPLLFELAASPAPTQATTFEVTATITGGSGSITNGLSSHLKVLQYAGATGSFVTGSTIVLSPAHPTGFAYISGIKSEDLSLTNDQLNVTLTMQQADDPANAAIKSFLIRKPPIVLVHGFDSDMSTWGEDFLGTIVNSGHHMAVLDPTDNFVVAIEYGVDDTQKDRKFENRTQSFSVLAQKLSDVLGSQIENSGAGRYYGWAMTRYDLICHSQGGVLARMLCALHPGDLGVAASFKNENNAFRGRFRRVVTVGAPQNGSTLEYYVAKYTSNLQPGGDPSIIYEVNRTGVAWKDLIQDKFNPFGYQVRQINDPKNQIDPDARFHLIRGAVTGVPFIFQPYYLTGDRLSVVLPKGSDGVVDFDSQTAAQVSPIVETAAGSISHAPPESQFGVDAGATETKSATVAVAAVAALDGNGSNFGPFKLPALLSDARKAAIDAVVPGWSSFNFLSFFKNLTRDGTSALGPAGISSFTLTLTPEVTEPLQDSVTWDAVAYGPEGVSKEGLTIQPGVGDSLTATLVVDDTVQGDVVAYASYPSTTGKIIFGQPIVVLSRPVGNTLTGIEIVPNGATVTVGDEFAPAIWGNYSDGQTAELFQPLTNGPVFSVGDSSVLFSAGGHITAVRAGVSTLSVGFLGFTSQITITSLERTGVPPPPAPQFANISTRLKVQTADNVLIGGFIVTGTQPKPVIIRAIGPSLGAAGVVGALADPYLELYDATGAAVATNDNWADNSNKQAVTDSGVAPTNAKESAILRTLAPGAYTAIVRGVNDTTGVGLVEVYDLNQTLDSKPVNISTRGLVQTGDNVMIGGTIVLGTVPANILIRAIGPSLPVAGSLADPTLELHDASGAIIASNDNWKDSQQAEIEATTIPPTRDAESAIVQLLSPGAYTAIVRGKNNTTGVALVEAYQLGK